MGLLSRFRCMCASIPYIHCSPKAPSTRYLALTEWIGMETAFVIRRWTESQCSISTPFGLPISKCHSNQTSGLDAHNLLHHRVIYITALFTSQPSHTIISQVQVPSESVQLHSHLTTPLFLWLPRIYTSVFMTHYS